MSGHRHEQRPPVAGDDRRRSRAVASASVVVLGAPVALSLLLLDDAAALWVRLLLVQVGLVGVALHLWWYRPSRPRPWVLVLAGLTATIAGDVAVLVATSGSGPGTNLPLDSWLTAVSGVLVLAGVVDASRIVRGPDLGGSLDASAVAVAGAVVLWQMLVVPAAAPGWAGTGLEIAGSIQILAMLSVGALMLRTTAVLPAGQRVAGGWIVVAVGLSVASYLLGAVRESLDLAAQYGGWRAVTGALTMLAVAAGAMHPSSRWLTRRVELPEDNLTPGRLLGYALALLAPIVVLTRAVINDGPIAWITMLVGWYLLVVLVLSRIALLGRGRTIAQRQATATEQRLAALLARTGDVMLLITRDEPHRRIIYASPAVDQKLGTTPSALLGTDPTLLAIDEDRSAFAALLDGLDDDRAEGSPDDDRAEGSLDGARAEGSPDDVPRSVDLRLREARGPARWFDAVADHGPDLPDQGRTLVVTLRDVTERKRAEAAWVEAALQDPLTRLPNRRGIEDHVLRAVAQYPPADLEMAVLLCDLDGFKMVNDVHGHPAGDQVLVHLAERLLRVTRDGDVVGRLGGDEFVVVCVGTADRGHLTSVADRLLGTVANPFHVEGAVHQIGMSVGIAAAAGPDTSLHLLVREADAALYRAKHAGRGRVEWAEAEPATA